MAEIFLDGLVTSAVIGITLSFGIIYITPRFLNSMNGTTYHKNTTDLIPAPSGKNDRSVQSDSSEDVISSKQTRKLKSILGISHSEILKSLKEEVTVRKSRKIQKVLGMTEFDVRNALQKVSEKCEIEEEIIRKTRKLQKVLGMDEQDVREATRLSILQSMISGPHGSRYESKREAANEQLGPVNWFKILDGFVIVILLALFCYFFNNSTNGDFARVLVGLFPREFEALGLKEYFERLSPDDPRITKQDLT
jgi:hypothetical protein